MKKAKKDHFPNLDVNSVLDNRKFWQNVKLLFSNKVTAKTTIFLYFVNTVKSLGILTEMESATFTENNLIEVEMALKK